MQNVLIPNKKLFEAKKKKFSLAGADSIQVLTDFDRTLTMAVHNGRKINTIISQIRHHDLLGEEYSKKAFALFDEYHPIEIDPKILMVQKMQKMQEWWSRHLGVIVDYGLDRNIINKVVEIQSKSVRQGVTKFFRLLSSHKVPVLILSSALGDVIDGVLAKKKILTPNVHVISNYFSFDKNGKAVGYKGKIIHVFNKNEAQIAGTPHFEKISARRKIILIGDSLGDLKMTEQTPYDEILRIGFLVENQNEQLEEFKKHFDVVLLGDGNFDFINTLIEEILYYKK